MSFKRFLSSFWLKIIAMSCMFLDHLGLMLGTYYLPPEDPIYMTLRIIGRIALPLFCFMIAEGVIHTRHFGKYALRLGIMAAFVTTALIVIKNALPEFEQVAYYGNIFLDLLLGAVAVYCLRQEKWYIKALSILPLAYGIASYIVGNVETGGAIVHWFPYFLRTQYGWYGIAMIIGFNGCYLFKDVFLSMHASNIGVDKDVLVGTDLERSALNLLALFNVIIMTSLYCVLPLFIETGILSVQWFAIVPGLLLLLYNGKRGYNAKWFEYGGYIFYPLHLGILALVFYLITL